MPLDLTRVKAICFDVDGTLSDTDDEWVTRFSVKLRGVNFLFRQRDPKRFVRRLVMFSESPSNFAYYWLDRLSLDDNFARLYERTVQHRRISPRRFWLMKGARELLTLLSERFPLSIVSARDEITTLRFVEEFSLASFFKAFATSQTCEHTKPYPHPVLWAAERMQVPAQNCLMIGDTTVDILAGKAAGAQTVGVLCGFGKEGELRRAGADLIVQDLKELFDLFKK